MAKTKRLQPARVEGDAAGWREIVRDVAKVRAILDVAMHLHVDSVDKLSAKRRKEGVHAETIKSYLTTAFLPAVQDCATLIDTVSESEIERLLYQSLLLVSVRDNPIGMLFLKPTADAPTTVQERQEWVRGSFHLDRVAPGWRATDHGLPEDQAWQRRLMIARLFHDALHVIPQAGIPGGGPTGKNIRVDSLVFVPDRPKFRVVVECDGFQYHGERPAFVADRQRDRTLAAAGYRVLRFSGSEIWNDPMNSAMQLFQQLDALKRAASVNRRWRNAPGDEV